MYIWPNAQIDEHGVARSLRRFDRGEGQSAREHWYHEVRWCRYKSRPGFQTGAI